MNKRRVSLKEIAAKAGVSSALVSMVLNGKSKKYGIGEEATKRVLQIAREMNYSPNIMARGLRSGKSYLIGLVVADIANPFFASLAREIEKTASECGYTVIYGSSDEDSKLMEHIMQTFVNQGVDGLVVVPCEQSRGFVKECFEQRIPMVLVDRDYPDLNIPSVMLDNLAAARSLTQHLIEQGHRRIGYVTFDSQLSHVRNRLAGYEQTMLEAGLSPDVHRFSLQHDPQSMKQLLSEILVSDKRCEALIFSNNTLTIDGLYAIRELSLRIPDDVAVVGYDGGDVFDLYTPPISYVKQPILDMGREAVQLLLKQLESTDVPSLETIVMQPEFFFTQSAARR